MPGPLDGLCVLDLTYGYAGPYCTKLLADFGAEVIKIENPAGGDPTRNIGPFPGGDFDPEASATFLHLNANKLGVTLDFASGEGKELFRRLVGSADIVVENFAPDTMDALGLGYDVLADITPRVVHTSITPFGASGPYHAWTATDLTLMAMGGWMFNQGEPGREPLYAGGEYVSYMAGQYAALGTVLAVLEAETSGRGQQVEVSQFEVAVTSTLYDSTGFSYTGNTRSRRGNHFGSSWLALPTADGFIGLTTIQGWEEFWMILLGDSDIPARPSLAADPAEMADREEAVRTRLAGVSKDKVFEVGQMLRELVGVVLDDAEVLNSPQFAARDYFQTLDHSATGPLRYPGAPVRMPRSPWALTKSAPLQGEHTVEVLSRIADSTRSSVHGSSKGGSVGHDRVQF